MEKTITADEAKQQMLQAAPKQRFVGIDIVKILAVFLVVCIHFFLYNGFYSTPIQEERQMIYICLRWIAYCCVPLFMITTGYLMKNKTLCKKHYMGLIKIIVIYLIMSVACAVFDHYHYAKEFTAWSFIRGLFMFSDAPYSWYVKYQICMMLLIPFINLAFNGLKNKKQQLVLVITALGLTTFARSLFIGFDRETQIQLLPNYFDASYGIAYYLVGAYIRENPPKRCLRNKLIFLAGLAAALGWNTFTTYKHSIANEENNFIFASWHYNDYGSWPVFLASLFIFLLIFDISSKNKAVTSVLRVLSEATLGCYLFSYIMDNNYYIKFNGKYPEMDDRFLHGYEIILTNFAVSMLVALAVHNLYKLVEWLIIKLISRRKKTAADACAK
ncbi:MAG: acyltransferase [Ruminococcus sp.]